MRRILRKNRRESTPSSATSRPLPTDRRRRPRRQPDEPRGVGARVGDHPLRLRERVLRAKPEAGEGFADGERKSAIVAAELHRRERRLWKALRLGSLRTTIRRRQRPIVRSYADFVCLEHLLVIELDGSQHAIAITIPLVRVAAAAWLARATLLEQ